MRRRWPTAILVLFLAIITIASACSSAANSSQPDAGASPETVDADRTADASDESTGNLPVAVVAGEPCGEAAVCSSREIELFGRTYVGGDTIGRRRLGNEVATAEGQDVSAYQIREITGIEPQTAFVVVDEAGSRTIYEQKAGVTVDGPLLVRTNAPGFNNDATLEGGPTEIANVNGCMTAWEGQVMLWPHGTQWDASKERIVFVDGTSARVGDQVNIAGHSSRARQVADQFGPEVAEYLENCAARWVYFANNEIPEVR